MPLENGIILYPIVMIGYTVAAITGFGSSIIILTLGAFLLPLESLIPVIVPMNLALGIYLAGRYRKSVDFPLLVKRHLPITALGLPFGYLALREAGADWLKFGLGALVLSLSVLELIAGARKKPSRTGPASNVWLFLGGVIQGLYIAGGPILVYYLSRAGLNKIAFRSMVSALFVPLNVALAFMMALDGKIDAGTLLQSATLAPALVAGIAVGEWAHHRVSEEKFRMAVYAALVAIGAALMTR